jgi:hypothetical protein
MRWVLPNKQTNKNNNYVMGFTKQTNKNNNYVMGFTKQTNKQK